RPWGPGCRRQGSFETSGFHNAVRGRMTVTAHTKRRCRTATTVPAAVRAAAAALLAAAMILAPAAPPVPLASNLARSAGTVHAAAEPPITIFLDGRPLPTDVPPEIIGGRTKVPMRAIFDALG